MRVRQSLKSNFLAGLVLAAPAIVTILVIKIGAEWVLGTLSPVVEGTRLATLTGGNQLAAQVLVAVVLLAGVTLLGFVAQYSVGRRLFGRTGRAIDFIPIVRTIYGSVRQVATSVTERQHEFDDVVYVEYPREGVYSIGLVTTDGPESARKVADGDVTFVFFPGSPNPTQGRLILVPDEDLHETGLSVRRGVQLLMTTGMADEQPVIDYEEVVGRGRPGEPGGA